MLKIFKYFKGKYGWLIFLGILFILIQILASYSISIQLNTIITIFKNNPSAKFNEYINTFYYFIGVSILSVILSVTSVILIQKAVAMVINNIRKLMFKKIQTFSAKDIDKFTASSLIVRITSDAENVLQSFSIILRFFVRGMFLFIFGIITGLIISPTISITFVIIIPIMLIVVAIFGKTSTPYFKKERKVLDKVNDSMRENILGARVIKSFNLDKQQAQVFSKSNAELTRIGRIAFSRAAVMPSIGGLIFNFGLIGMIWIAGFTNSLVQIIPFINIFKGVFFGMVIMLFVSINVLSAFPCAKRINEVLEYQIEVEFPENSKAKISEGLIEFKNVSFKHSPKSKNILSNLNFKILPNQKVGIIGTTGSGKSTLVNLIARQYDSTKGNILIDNNRINTIKKTDLTNNIAISFQHVTLFFGTIKSNIALGLKNDSLDQKIVDQKIFEAAKSAEAISFINSKENKFDSIVEQRGKNLSGGQKQRVAIARALIRKPKILILDDSTSALDTITENKIKNNIFSKFKTTLIVVAQRISSIQNMDNILVMDEGKIVAQGDHHNLIQNCKIYREIVISQLGSKAIPSSMKESL